MPTQQDFIIAKKAVQHHFIGPQELQQCMLILKKLEFRKKSVPLYKILIKKGFLSVAQAKQLLREERHSAQTVSLDEVTEVFENEVNVVPVSGVDIPEACPVTDFPLVDLPDESTEQQDDFIKIPPDLPLNPETPAAPAAKASRHRSNAKRPLRNTRLERLRSGYYRPSMPMKVNMVLIFTLGILSLILLFFIVFLVPRKAPRLDTQVASNPQRPEPAKPHSAASDQTTLSTAKCEELYQQAYDNVQRRNWREASKQLGYLHQLGPQYKHAEVLKLWARCQLQLNQPRRALKTIANYIKLVPQDHEAYLIQGESYFLLCDYDKALDTYRQCIQINPALLKPYRMITIIHEKRGNLIKALQNIQQAIKAGLDSPKLHDDCLRIQEKLYTKGNKLIMNGNFEEVRTLLAQACQYDGNMPIYSYLEGLLLMEERNYQAAIPKFEFALQDKNFSHHFELYHRLAEAYGQQNRIPEALAIYQQALATSTLAYVQVFPWIIEFYIAHNQLDRARAYCSLFAKVTNRPILIQPYQPQLGDQEVPDSEIAKYVTWHPKFVNVQSAGEAARAGIMENDVILECNGVAVSYVNDLVQALKQAHQGNIVFKLQRGAKVFEISVPSLEGLGARFSYYFKFKAK